MQQVQKSTKGFQEVKTTTKFALKELNFENVKLLLPFVSRGSLPALTKKTTCPTILRTAEQRRNTPFDTES